MLYFVATPIGNLKDISFRAIEILSQADIIFCEDTRVSSVLLNHYNISKPLQSYHKFNEREMTEKIISLANEKNVCVISDSGCPIISDPGQILAEALRENDINYSVVPGANACLSALMLSGFDSRTFMFLGFLPSKNIDKQNLFENIKKFHGSLVFYISPHSIDKDISDIFKGLGNRKACLVKEITKIFETTIFFNLGDELDFNKKGEFVLVVEGDKNQNEEIKEFDLDKEYENLIKQGIAPNKAISTLAKKIGKPRNELYMHFKGKN